MPCRSCGRAVACDTSLSSASTWDLVSYSLFSPSGLRRLRAGCAARCSQAWPVPTRLRRRHGRQNRRRGPRRHVARSGLRHSAAGILRPCVRTRTTVAVHDRDPAGRDPDPGRAAERGAAPDRYATLCAARPAESRPYKPST